MYTFDELSESFGSLIQQRHSEIRDAGKEITKLLSSSNRVLKVNKGVPAWKAYVDYFSNIVIDGFTNAIICTTRYLLNQIDPEVSNPVSAQPLAVKHMLCLPLLGAKPGRYKADILWLVHMTGAGQE